LGSSLSFLGMDGWIKIALGMEVGLSPGHIVLGGDWGPSSTSPKKGAEPPIFRPFLLWPNGWMDQDDTCYGGRPLPRRHCVRWDPPPKKAHSPQFSAHVYCGQTAVCIRIPLGMEVGLSLGDIVLDGDQAAPLLKEYSPQFSAHVCCGQTAGWTKMPLGMEVGLSPGNFVLDGTQLPPEKVSQPPPIQFSAHVYCGQMAGWMKTPLGTEADVGPGHIVLDRDPAPTAKGAQPHPLFSAHVYCGHGRPSQLLLSSCLQLKCTWSGVSSKLGFRCRRIVCTFSQPFCHADNVFPLNCSLPWGILTPI